MKARKHYDRFSTVSVLNARGVPIVALMIDRQPQILKALSDHNQFTAHDILVIVGGNKRSLYDTLRVLKTPLTVLGSCLQTYRPNDIRRVSVAGTGIMSGNYRAL
jgi:hypothetical protein